MITAKADFRLNRLLSTPLSRLLLRFPVTPNHVTAASLACGLTAGVFFFRGRYGSMLAGALLYEMACVLDNCDGDIARAKKLGTPLGAWLDIAADYICDLALFLGVGLSMLRHGFHAGTAAATALCVFGGLMHLLMVVAEKMNGFGPAQFDAPNPDRAKRSHFLFKIFDALREGDASWLVVLFALVGKAHTLVYFGGAYMQLLWVVALAMNLRHMRMH